jgi:hypothetical protein
VEPAPRGYVYTYPPGESQPYALAMQGELIREVEGNRPAYVVFVHVPESWSLPLEQSSPLLDWEGGRRPPDGAPSRHRE